MPSNHKVNWELNINFEQDGVSAKVTGEGVVFKGEIIRHRHTRLISNIERLIKEYIHSQPKEDNAQSN